jgi:hypothetical protein
LDEFEVLPKISEFKENVLETPFNPLGPFVHPDRKKCACLVAPLGYGSTPIAWNLWCKFNVLTNLGPTVSAPTSLSRSDFT